MLDFAIFAITFLLILVGAVLYLYPYMDNDDSRIRGRLWPSLIGRGNLYDIIVAMATIMTSSSLSLLLIGRGNLYDIIVAMATIMTSSSPCPLLIGRGLAASTNQRRGMSTSFMTSLSLCPSGIWCPHCYIQKINKKGAPRAVKSAGEAETQRVSPHKGGFVRSSRQACGIPGLAPSEEKDGNLQDIVSKGSLHEFLVNLHEKFGAVASFWFGRRLVVSLGSLDLLRQHINPNKTSDPFQMMLKSLLGYQSGVIGEATESHMQKKLYENAINKSLQSRSGVASSSTSSALKFRQRARTNHVIAPSDLSVTAEDAEDGAAPER
ncbi:unnamed protein product [Ranitomeya imitator]|uniref:Uncharacterized protein n=1 Tax=Ranitomeya imitator TaxID=111125 RepID=A0ABN9KUG7_9NEOB|nr:unnamed protein product [Ranitomeya imitator]